MKKIVFSSDHGGFILKEQLIKYVQSRGFETIDLGTKNGEDSVSYALYGKKLAVKLKEDLENQIGIGICGTGLGISYALNRHKKIRAARVTDTNDAMLAKQHNNANVLVFGGRFTKFSDAKDMFDTFMETEFEGGRHILRIDELDK
ncbi:MAG: RpiB/LacA/LacB family sugar-phosphate isomerase [Mycoplasmataceae bacterium]|nr:RpiB/LacA/LacB family sugar-phosphate isomerase [Mycoplasmataceae bacterium]